jgi:signal transduction histidine kinase
MRTQWGTALKKATQGFNEKPENNIRRLLVACKHAQGAKEVHYIHCKAKKVIRQFSSNPQSAPLDKDPIEQGLEENDLAARLAKKQSSFGFCESYLTSLTACGDESGILVFFYEKGADRHLSDLDGLNALIALLSAFEKIMAREKRIRIKKIRAQEDAHFMDAILASLQDGVMVVDANGKILIHNAAAGRIMGERPIDDGYQSFGTYYKFFEEDEVTPIPREALPVARALAGEIMNRIPVYVVAPGSSQGVHITVSGGPVRDAQSRIIGAAVTLIDMTAFRETQSKLNEQHQLLAYASRLSAVGELAGAIAHEINTPLATISLVTEALKKNLASVPTELPLKVNDHLDMLGKLTDRIAKIVRSLRSVCRAGNGDPFTTATIDRIVSDTEELCVEKLRMNAINFSVKKEVEFETGIECRTVQVVQVLLNLISNACDAIKEHEQRWIVLEVSQLDDYIEFRVTDSGPRISDKVAAKLFTPLFSTKPEGQGSGIGLHVSKRIIESHGGKIALNREYPNTQFVIRLPILQKASESVAA